jgi:hypothetical protein
MSRRHLVIADEQEASRRSSLKAKGKAKSADRTWHNGGYVEISLYAIGRMANPHLP